MQYILQQYQSNPKDCRRQLHSRRGAYNIISLDNDI